MKRPIVLVASLSTLVVAALVVGALTAPLAEPTWAERVERLAGQLRCPDCQALSVAESRTRAADAIRVEIEEQVAAGRSDVAIRQHFVDRYGEWILLAPSDPVAWWLPVAVILAGIAAFGAWLLLGRAAPQGVADFPPQPAEAERRRVRDELEALDG